MTGWKALPTHILAEAGVTCDPDGLVRIPYRLHDGSLYAERVAASSGRRWWRPGDGRPLIPFGIDRLETAAFRKYRDLAIVEGESDTLALRAALGHEGVDVLGVPGARTWKSAWATYTGGYHDVYVLGDGDEPGRDLNATARRDVPNAIVVDLPAGRDVRDVVQADHGLDELLTLLRQAKCGAELSRAFLNADSIADFDARVAQIKAAA